MIKLQKFYLAAAVALAAGASFAVDVYRNDFSTRTSDQPLPGDRWFSYTYDPSVTLYHNYGGNATPSSTLPWSDNTQYQDGWAKAYMDSGAMSTPPGFAVATDPDHGSADNYFALFRSSSSRIGCAIQPLHNEFTNGTIRFEVDIRRPSVWGSQAKESHTARAMLVYRKYMDPMWSQKVIDTQFPVMFGAAWEGASEKQRLALLRTDGDGNRGTFNPGASASYECNDHWYRWRVYVNIDQQYCTCYIWDVGENQPDGRNTMGDSTATRKVEKTDTYFFADPMTEETGGIAGIGFNAYRFLTGTGDSLAVTNAPCFDNVYLAWKAPGSSEYVSFYENDFTTRRYRRIQPTPSTTTDYPVNVGVSSVDIFSSYKVNASNSVDSSSVTYLVDHSATGTLGMDNWKRLVSGNRFSVVDSPTRSGGAMLRASNGGNGVMAQTLGEKITSGKVRISGDVRLPAEWKVTSSTDPRVCLALGSDTYWSGDPGSYMSRHIGYGAIVGEAKDEFHPAYLPTGSAALVSTKDTSVTCTPTNWYRMVVTADLDVRKYDYELYELGEDAGAIDRADVPSTPIYATNGISFRNGVSNVPNIGAFSLFAYRGGTNWNTYILWDNIQVWKDWDSSAGTGTLIYSNDFNVRRRYVEREKTELVHGVNTGTGVDAWEQVNKGDGTAWIMGGANRFLSIKAPNHHSLYLTQPLPFEVPCGQRVTFRVDVRPPCWWLEAGGQFLNIYLGGDTMCQHADPDASPSPLDDSVLAFSVYPATGTLGLYTNTVIRAQNGSGMPSITGRVETDHWYRLEGSTISGSGMWKFRAYDMGVAHPDIDAPPGELVVHADGLARRSSVGATSGISSFCITACGVAGLEPWDVYDRGRVLVDNIVVTALPSGACIIIR